MEFAVRQNASVVIVDLDNTLWDWLGIWHASFEAMLRELAIKSGLPESRLKADIQRVFEKRQTSEYSFVIEELQCLRELHPGVDLSSIYESAINEFRKARSKKMKLFPGVYETLWRLHDCGCIVAGYTESMAFYTNYRIRKLSLDGLLDFIYSPQDHGIPAGLSREQMRFYESDRYRLKISKHEFTPQGALKPNPVILESIIERIGANKKEVIYVGDSLMQDIPMAHAVGVADVYALYGECRNRPEYELLREVSHWPKQKIKDEVNIYNQQHYDPHASYILEHSFAQILNLFDFEPHDRGGKFSAFQTSNRLTLSPDYQVTNHTSYDQKEAENMIEIWKKIVDVQMHFNTIELQIRNFAITLVVAVLGAASIAVKEHISVNWRGSELNLAPLLLSCGLIGLLAFYMMDRFWYHRLLEGAVSQGIEIEKNLDKLLPGVDLASALKRKSPLKLLGIKLDSSRKMDLFYGVLGMLFLLLIMSTKSLA